PPRTRRARPAAIGAASRWIAAQEAGRAQLSYLPPETPERRRATWASRIPAASARASLGRTTLVHDGTPAARCAIATRAAGAPPGPIRRQARTVRRAREQARRPHRANAPVPPTGHATVLPFGFPLRCPPPRATAPRIHRRIAAQRRS